GENHRLLNSGEHQSSFFKTMWDVINKGQIWRGEIKNQAKNGSFYWVDSTIVPLRDDQGELFEFISIRTDITKLKALEQQLNNDKSYALIRAQVSQILQGQNSLKERVTEALAAISQGHSFKIQNKLGVFLLPEGANELKMFVTHGEYSNEFLHSEQCVKLGSCLCGRAAISGKLIISDDCMTDPDHDHDFEDMTSHGHYILPLKHNKKILGILFIYTDTYPSREQSKLDTLTFIGDMFGLAIANEEIKNQLELSKENAENMAQMKADFLANMSHEIRTPMNGVLGMLDLLNNTPLDDKASGYVDIAHSSAAMLLNVINDILDISKIESGKLHIEEIEFDLRKTIEDSADLLAEMAHKKGLELSVYIPPETRNLIRGDVLRLQQVINNLTSNAIKFTSDGEVSITISIIEEVEDKTRLRFEIKDTGIGIAAEKQNELFQAFTQADTSTSREFGGTGLGLAISKSLIEMMEGEIGLNSVIGEGSIFWFELPFDIVSQDDQYYSTLDDLNILIIDDNKTNCLILENYIKSWGATSVTETRPEKGLHRLKDAHTQGKPFNVLLLDRQMPGMSGDDVAIEIRKESRFSELKIILLSSMGLQQDKQAYFDLMLNKPIRQSFLYDAIATVQKLNLVKKKIKLPAQSREGKLTGRILFVDDNLVNQIVGKEMLFKLGLDFEVVSNGQEALEARVHNNFDAILMDCQMPVMDGFEATRQIRLFESKTKTDRVTIIALTANTMQGDRERCLAAGMDDYLAKPYTIQNIFETLSSYLSLPDASIISKKITETNTQQSIPAVNKVPATQLTSHTNVIDVIDVIDIIDIVKFEETREMMGDSMGLIVNAFEESGASNITEMQSHFAAKNYEGLRNSVHALKSSSATLGAQKLYQICHDTEGKCRRGETDNMGSIVETISTLFDKSQLTIRTLMKKQEDINE
nr:response regulator [Colwellia sp.]